MSEIESPAEVGDKETAVAARTASSIDLDTRPDVDWLNEVEGEIGDVDLVLKCLARDSASVCDICAPLEAQGLLAARPVLARCAGTKQPTTD